MNYAKFTPEDFFKLDTSNFDEKEIQKALIAFYRKFIAPLFPDCVLIVNPFSSKVMTAKEMNRAKSQGFDPKQPDIIFIHPDQNGQNKIGLAIEVKKDGYEVFNIDGSLRENKHLQEQSEVLHKLKRQGFRAVFGEGYKLSLLLITQYFNMNQNPYF